MFVMNRSFLVNKPTYRVAALLALAEVVTVLVPVVQLGQYFEFPDILRQPAAYGLALFLKNQAHIVPAYYVFMMSGLLFVPLSYALSAVLKPHGSLALRQALTGTGLATAVFQAIGFSRWLFVVPFLAEQYARQPAERPALALLYETLNRYAGMTIGEHLGFLSMGAWTILLAGLFVQAGVVKRWFAWLGVPIGAGLVLSIGEHFGGPSAERYATLNFAANAAWSVWMLALSGWLVFARPTGQSTLQPALSRQQ